MPPADEPVVDNLPPRDESGRFMPRAANDLPIDMALAEHAREHPPAKATDDKAGKKDGDKPDKPDEKPPEGEPQFKQDPEGAAKPERHVWDDFVEAPTKGKEKPAAKAKPGEKPAPKPAAQPKPAAPAKEVPLTAAEIAAAAAEGATRAFRDHQPGKQDQPKPDEGPVLPPKEQRRVAVLEHMEKLYPDQPEYKDISKRYKASLLSFSQYADKWEQEHPGQEFDENAEEHKAFMEKNDVPWDQDDYIEAIADMKSAQNLTKGKEDLQKEINQRLSPVERAEKLRAEAATIATEQNLAAKKYWEQFGDEFKGIVNEEGMFDTKKIQELSQSDPVGFGFRWAAAKDFNQESGEIHKLFNGLVDFDEKNPVHQEIDRFVNQLEEALAARPRNEKVDEQGRIFATAAEWNKLTKEQRQDRWKLNARLVIGRRARFLKEDTEAKIKSQETMLEQMARAKGWTIPEGGRNTRPAQNNEPPAGEDEPLNEGDEKPNSPSGSAAPGMAGVRPGRSGGNPNSGKSFMNDI